MFPGSRREAGKKSYRPRDAEVCLILEEPLVSARPPWRAGLPEKESYLFFGNPKYPQARLRRTSPVVLRRSYFASCKGRGHLI